MKRSDAIKAVGLAVVTLALNLALVTCVIFAYAKLIAPGHPDSFYDEAAPRIATWWTPACGALILLAFMAWLGGRRPDRNAYLFAAVTWALYAVIDVGSGWAMGGIKALVSLQVAISMLTALAGALAGAAIAKAGSARQEPAT